MLVSNGGGGSYELNKPVGPQFGIDVSGVFDVLGQLFASFQKQKSDALEEQRLKLEASMRQKIADEMQTTRILIGAIGVLLVLALLLRR